MKIVKVLNYPTLLGACHATSGILSAVLVPTREKFCEEAGEGPENGHIDDQRTGKLP